MKYFSDLGCVSVETVFRVLLDTISGSCILSSWRLSPFRKKGISAVAANTSGCLVRVRTGSPEFVQNARVRTGINLARYRGKRHKHSYIKDLAGSAGFEPATLLGLSPARVWAFGVLVLQTSGLNHSPNFPLNRWRQSESNRLALVLRTPLANLLPPSVVRVRRALSKRLLLTRLFISVPPGSLRPSSLCSRKSVFSVFARLTC